MKSTPRRILVCRTDALGDTILALPVCSALKRAFPDAQVSFLVSTYAAPLFTGQAVADEVQVWMPGDSSLRRRWHAQAHDLALLVFPDRRVSWEVFRAGIPQRVGTGRRWWSCLYTQRVPHRRSQALRHEADYNLDLVRALGVDAPLIPPAIQVMPAARDWAQVYLASQGVAPDEPLVVIHPGSRGSADNWPVEHYHQLGRELLGSGLRLLFTGSPAEHSLLAQATAGLGALALRLDQAISLPQLAALIARAQVFVSSSTGPMHLAAALGIATVSLFPASGVTGPVRWAPLGNQAQVVAPAPGQPLATISPAQVARRVRDVLRTRAKG